MWGKMQDCVCCVWRSATSIPAVSHEEINADKWRGTPDPWVRTEIAMPRPTVIDPVGGEIDIVKNYHSFYHILK